jgi:hypothetical protein
VILSDVYKIKKQIKKIKLAILEKDSDKVLSFISIKYIDDFGLTYAVIYSNIESTFDLIEDINGNIENLSAYTFKEKDKKFGIAYMQVSGYIQFNSSVYDYLGVNKQTKFKIEIKFIKELGKWKIIQVIDANKIE